MYSITTTPKICCRTTSSNCGIRPINYVIVYVTTVFVRVNMVCSEEDKILIKKLYQLKEYKTNDGQKIASTGC